MCTRITLQRCAVICPNLDRDGTTVRTLLVIAINVSVTYASQSHTNQVFSVFGIVHVNQAAHHTEC